MKRLLLSRTIVTSVAIILILLMTQNFSAQSAFTYQIVAKTGDLGINQIWPEVSVNGGGKVAFLATVPRTDGITGFTDHIFVYDGTNTVDISPGVTGASESRMMPGVLINNNDRALIRRRLETPSPLGTIVSTYVDAWYANLINTYDRWVIGVPITGQYDGIYPYLSFTNSDGFLFKALKNNENRLVIWGVIDIGPLLGDVNQRRPMLADNHTLILRSSSAPFSLSVIADNFSSSRIIASQSNGFNGSSIGMNSSISDDGKIIVFYADVLPASFPDTVGLNPGVGIFAAVNDAGAWKYKRLAGLRNNGWLDPGETFVDLNGNGQFDPPTEIDDGPIAGFFPDEKIGVSNLGVVVYKATNNLSQKTVQANHITLSNLNLPASAPLAVATQGDTINGLPATMQDFTLYDPITTGGDGIAFYATLQNGDQAVIKAAECAPSTPLSDGPGGGTCQVPVITFEPTVTAPSGFQQITDNPTNSGNPIPIPNTNGGNLGVGKRIFPDKKTLGDSDTNKRVKVKAQTNFPNRPLYFKSFDVDDPSSEVTPLDTNGASDGNTAIGGDNRGRKPNNPNIIERGTFSPNANYPNTCTIPSNILNAFCVRTDAFGVAIVDFETGMNPGDNYRIGVAFDLGDLELIKDDQVYRINNVPINLVLNSASTISMLNGRVGLSEILYVWRRLHIEVDSMGNVTSNRVEGTVATEITHAPRRTSLTLSSPEIPNLRLLGEGKRFEKGRITINGVDSFKVIRSDLINIGGQDYLFVLVEGRATRSVGRGFRLYDDDNLSQSSTLLLHGDENFNVDMPAETQSLIQTSDDPSQNAFAYAYIRPVTNTLDEYKDDFIDFLLNVCSTSDIPSGDPLPCIDNVPYQLGLGMETENYERDDFWIAYVQGAYQSRSERDNDPNTESNSNYGVTLINDRSTDTDNDGTHSSRGGRGSLIFRETEREGVLLYGRHPGRTAAHEIGHQLGLKGDNYPNQSSPDCIETIDFGLMSYTNNPFSTTLHPCHISKIRYRTTSPGQGPVSSNLSSTNLNSIAIDSVNESHLEKYSAIRQTSVVESTIAGGDLDPTFDSDGKVTTELSTIKDDFAYAVKVQSDGKIIVVGDTNNGANTDFGVVRYNTDGSLDTASGSGGKVTFPFGNGFDFVNGITVQSDGKIVLAGYTEGAGNNLDFALVRLQVDGAIDSTFGTNGKVTTDIAGNADQIVGMVLQADGKILVSGSTDNGIQADIALARYNSDGTLDTTFDTDGIVVTSFSNLDEFASDISLQTDGKIVIAGEVENGTNTDFFVARYDSSGTLDNTFGTNGKTIIDFASSEDGATSLAIRTDGKIVVGGYTGNLLNPDFALARFNIDGTLDTAFGTNGKVVTDFVGNAEFVNDIAVHSDGAITAVGHSYSNTDSDLAIARYLHDGTLDATFGTGGKVMTPIGTSDDFGIATAIQPDNKVVVAGASFNGNNDDFAVSRYLSNAASINGTVTYGNAVGAATPRFVSNVTISGAGSTNVMTTTAAPGVNAGQYTLTGFGSGSYTVTPTKTGGVNGAISSFDAGRIALHVAGPPNPQLNATQLLVADVSGNGAVTSFDAGMIAKFVAGPPYAAPGIGATGTWRFTPVNRNYASVTSSISGEDFVALLMGEVSGNWQNTGARPVGQRPSQR